MKDLIKLEIILSELIPGAWHVQQMCVCMCCNKILKNQQLNNVNFGGVIGCYYRNLKCSRLLCWNVILLLLEH